MNKDNEREKFTTTLKGDIKIKLGIIASYQNTNRNIVIERLVEKEWQKKYIERKECLYEMDKKN